MCLSLLCLKCLPAGDYRLCFDGDTVLHKNIDRLNNLFISPHCHDVKNISGMIGVRGRTNIAAWALSFLKIASPVFSRGEEFSCNHLKGDCPPRQ